jgi:hypothetical protein
MELFQPKARHKSQLEQSLVEPVQRLWGLLLRQLHWRQWPERRLVDPMQRSVLRALTLARRRREADWP